MPTIAEPTPRGAVNWPPKGLDLQDHLEALVLDMQEAGVSVTPLGLVDYAMQIGVPVAIAIEMADMIGA